MSDLSEFMPSDTRALSLKPQPGLATLKALIAIDLGLHTILALLINVSEMYELGSDDSITNLKADLELLRNQPTENDSH